MIAFPSIKILKFCNVDDRKDWCFKAMFLPALIGKLSKNSKLNIKLLRERRGFKMHMESIEINYKRTVVAHLKLTFIIPEFNRTDKA